MRLTTTAALAATAIGGLLVLSGAPADAASKQRQAEGFVFSSQNQRVVKQRPRSRITVRRERSFLDPGPELLPGEYKYRDYAEPLYYSPLTNAVPNQTWSRNPFNGPYDVPYRPWPGRIRF